MKMRNYKVPVSMGVNNNKFTPRVPDMWTTTNSAQSRSDNVPDKLANSSARDLNEPS